jgi:hypothetical protein
MRYAAIISPQYAAAVPGSWFCWVTAWTRGIQTICILTVGFNLRRWSRLRGRRIYVQVVAFLLDCICFDHLSDSSSTWLWFLCYCTSHFNFRIRLFKDYCDKLLGIWMILEPISLIVPIWLRISRQRIWALQMCHSGTTFLRGPSCTSFNLG